MKRLIVILANMNVLTMLFCMMLLVLPGEASAAASGNIDEAKMRSWVEQFKASNRGPFEHIRWFCNDGTEFDPGEGACSDHGGGRQHGVWNKKASQIRDNGILVANVLSALDSQSFTGELAAVDELSQVILEQFLIRIDDGWVFQRSRFFYRGALQVEDEEMASARLMLALLDDPSWRKPERYLLLRESLRLLPLAGDAKLAARVRQKASDLAVLDKDFRDLRIKLHSQPDSRDPERVRAYAAVADLSLVTEFQTLIDLLEQMYAPKHSDEQLIRLQEESTFSPLMHELERARQAMAGDHAKVIELASERLKAWRELLQANNSWSALNRLRLLQASLILEHEVFIHANALLDDYAKVSPATHIGWLNHMVTALYGTGLLSQRQMQSFQANTKHVLSGHEVLMSDYYAALKELGFVSQWAQRAMEFHFSAAVSNWRRITPLATAMVPDRLRESPLLPFSRMLDMMTTNISRLAGVSHQIFGREIDSRLRALNPGLNRGVLLNAPAKGERFRADGIYILPSTTQTLPPVAGIITLGEGSSLSHIQLLARNMGIPNIVADERLLNVIHPHMGESVIMAVSYGGSVNIEANAQKWDILFSTDELSNAVLIDPDLARLNLRNTNIQSLKGLRTSDSGRIVGPKAANLGELKHYYPELVPDGVVIPFGLFREHLEKPFYKGGPSVFDWMRSEYARLRRIHDEEQRLRETTHALALLRQWILTTDPGIRFRRDLMLACRRVFGDELPGMFVRSDTNVEDLPGFSGAGLNLTVPNVVGMEAVVAAVQRVWASPFTDRAFAWRQAHMAHPEHVYPGVLLQQGIDSDISGVMVTADVEDGDGDWLTVAVNEGVAGVVEGQAAEEVRIHRVSGRLRLISQASAPYQSRLMIEGGMIKVAASGSEQLLFKDHFRQLERLAGDVESRFPLPRDELGRTMAADIEFGFRQGQLTLFQIRPFVESRQARQSEVLIAMDRQLNRKLAGMVDLNRLLTMEQVE